MSADVLTLPFPQRNARDALCSVPCVAAVVAAGLERSSSGGGSVGQEQAGARGEQESSGPGAEARRELCRMDGWMGAGEHTQGNRSRDRAGAVMRQGQYSWHRNWSAGCSTWLFKFDLISLRSFFHLMLCKNWFYLPLIFFFLPPSPPVDE